MPMNYCLKHADITESTKRKELLYTSLLEED